MNAVVTQTRSLERFLCYATTMIQALPHRFQVWTVLTHSHSEYHGHHRLSEKFTTGQDWVIVKNVNYFINALTTIAFVKHIKTNCWRREWKDEKTRSKWRIKSGLRRRTFYIILRHLHGLWIRFIITSQLQHQNLPPNRGGRLSKVGRSAPTKTSILSF